MELDVGKKVLKLLFLIALLISWQTVEQQIPVHQQQQLKNNNK